MESELKLEDYSNSAFSMKKPVGWKVEASGTGMYYVIRVYDQNDSNNQIFLQLKMQPLLKSEAAKEFHQSYYGDSYKVFTEAVVLSNPTTEGFYQKFNKIADYEKTLFNEFAGANFPTFSNFTKIEEAEANTSMKSLALDSKVLRGTYTGDTGKDGEGLFLASIVNFGNLYYGNIDYSYYMVYDIMAITADKDNFINYKDILSESINSIEFTDDYTGERYQTITDNMYTEKVTGYIEK